MASISRSVVPSLGNSTSQRGPQVIGNTIKVDVDDHFKVGWLIHTYPTINNSGPSGQFSGGFDIAGNFFCLKKIWFYKCDKREDIM